MPPDGKNTLMLMCLNGIFYHCVNPPVAEWFAGRPPIRGFVRGWGSMGTRLDFEATIGLRFFSVCRERIPINGPAGEIITAILGCNVESGGLRCYNGVHSRSVGRSIYRRGDPGRFPSPQATAVPLAKACSRNLR